MIVIGFHSLGDHSQSVMSTALTSELFPRQQRPVTITRDPACQFQASLDLDIVRQTDGSNKRVKDTTST